MEASCHDELVFFVLHSSVNVNSLRVLKVDLLEALKPGLARRTRAGDTITQLVNPLCVPRFVTRFTHLSKRLSERDVLVE
jgi:hypothetical protein